MLVMIHTPHRDKTAGMSRSMDLVEEVGLDPKRVVIDHNNEETVKEVPTVGTGQHLPSIPRPKWAMNVWSKSCASMALIA